MHGCNRPAPPRPKNNSRRFRVANDRRRGTSLVPFSPEMSTTATRSSSDTWYTWYTGMRSTLTARSPRPHLAFSVVALYHYLVKNLSLRSLGHKNNIRHRWKRFTEESTRPKRMRTHTRPRELTFLTAHEKFLFLTALPRRTEILRNFSHSCSVRNSCGLCGDHAWQRGSSFVLVSRMCVAFCSLGSPLLSSDHWKSSKLNQFRLGS